MINIITLFITSFVTIALLGFQSQIVRLGHKKASFIVSNIIGFAQFYSIKLVSADGDMLALFSFMLGTSLGIVASIYIHDYYISYFKINDTRGVIND